MYPEPVSLPPQESGSNGLKIFLVVLIVIALALGGFSIWAYMNYRDQKFNTDSKINAAVEIAKKEQQAADEAEFLEREKNPYSNFTGASDFGSISFQYPRTWSGYVAQDEDNYEVIFNRGVVPNQSKDDSAKAVQLRVLVESQSYEEFVSDKLDAIQEKLLVSVPIEISGQKGSRFDGQIEEGIQGVQVAFKLRDKTLVLSAESNDYKKDFEQIILKSLEFNP